MRDDTYQRYHKAMELIAKGRSVSYASKFYKIHAVTIKAIAKELKQTHLLTTRKMNGKFKLGFDNQSK